MPELEKVITALQHCIYRPCHINCPYFEPNDKNQAYCLFKRILPDALALLKEQAPRVMTLDEIVKNGGEEPIYLECPDLGGVMPVIYQPDDFEDGYLGFSGSWRSSGYYHGMNYGKTWRCWTARPSDEQRKAVKWDD